MIQRFLFLLLLPSVLLNASQSICQQRVTQYFNSSAFEKAINNLQQKGIFLSGLDGVESQEKIRQVEAIFEVDEVLTIDSARNYMVEVVWVILDELNNNPYFQGLLDPTPFTADQLMVTVVGQEAKERGDDYIITARLYEGIIYYNTEYEGSYYVTVVKEPFEQAVEKYEQYN